ncbi:hypothetical protein OKW45_008084 [Paraburkholderia sp. WSM4175]|uniref:hypothetical protein n=1 Tax=Paraburkholderia sp. WSM4175 TaxID=2991072 RepID=UPI003D1F4437
MDFSNLKPKSESSVIRNMLVEIEVALGRGVTRQQVFEAIKAEHGLTMGFDGFCKALQRARKARGQAQGVQVAIAPLTLPKALAQAVAPVQAQSGVNKPPVDVAAALLDMKTNGLPKSEVEENSPVYISKAAAARYKAGPKPSDNPEY